MTSLITGNALAETINFDDAQPGATPLGWTATKTGKGEAKWTIEKDNTAPSKPNVLKQSGEATYPVCLKNDTSLKDGFVEVKFKPISGKEDQAGALSGAQRTPTITTSPAPTRWKTTFAFTTQSTAGARRRNAPT